MKEYQEEYQEEDVQNIRHNVLLNEAYQYNHNEE